MSKFKKGDMVIHRELTDDPVKVVVGEPDKDNCIILEHEGEYCFGNLRHIRPVPKKVKYLKPLHVVLAETGGYTITKTGTIHIPTTYSITPEMFQYFGNIFTDDGNWDFDSYWIEEREEEV